MKRLALPCLFLIFLCAAPGCSEDRVPPASICPASLACGRGCMRRHIEDGRTINEERLPRYDALTHGASLPISQMLIGYETFSLPFADIVDSRAVPWQEQEICIACFEFVSMERTPRFRDTFPGGPPLLPDFHPQDAAEMDRGFRSALDEEGFPGLSAALAAKLRELAQAPKFHCMLRHILESMLRISNLAPLFQQMAEARGLPSPLELSAFLTDLHFLVLGQAVTADGMAAPIQADDVPILCQDVPNIPPLPADIDCWLSGSE
jgi:hypothetical protein